MPAASQPSPLAFLADGGEMGAGSARFDWSRRRSARPSSWPQALKTAAGIVLSSKFPMFLAWGPELTFLYNDGYAEILGGKHPAALGQPSRTIWAEIWSDIGPIAARALAGEATFYENLPLTMTAGASSRPGSPSPTARSRRGRRGAAACSAPASKPPRTGARRAERVGEAERLRQLFDQRPASWRCCAAPTTSSS
jgi:hypothetical protein